MDLQNEKCVLIIDEALPLGNIANTAAVLQCCTDYDDYTAKIAGVPAEDLSYFGIAIYGPKKKINKLTGSLPLLR